MKDKIPKQLQDKLAQFQTLQNQLQMTSLQKQQLVVQMSEIENAISELEKLKKEKVFKSVGPLFIETTKAGSEKELNEAKETASARIKILENQEKKLGDKFKEMRQELETALSQVRGEGAG